MLNRSMMLLLFLVLSLTVILGCSSSDPRSHHVEGTVTFKGKVVPFGNVQFVPSKGNSGPAGYADIVDGKYATWAAGGKGTVGGPHTVVINGFDGKSNPEAELPHGKQLFREYKTEYDIPKESSPVTKDFNIDGKGP